MNELESHPFIQTLEKCEIELIYIEPNNNFYEPDHLKFNGYLIENYIEYFKYIALTFQQFKNDFERNDLSIRKKALLIILLQSKLNSLTGAFYEMTRTIKKEEYTYLTRTDSVFVNEPEWDQENLRLIFSIFFELCIKKQKKYIELLKQYLEIQNQAILQNILNEKDEEIHELSSDYIPLEKLFIDKAYMNYILSKIISIRPQICSKPRNSDKYIWEHRKKQELATLAILLKEKGRLNQELLSKGNQDLKRSFCQFFHIDISYKTFQPEEVAKFFDNKRPLFNFIDDFKKFH